MFIWNQVNSVMTCDFKFDMIFFYFVDYIFIFYDQIVAYIVVAVNSYEMKKNEWYIFETFKIINCFCMYVFICVLRKLINQFSPLTPKIYLLETILTNLFLHRRIFQFSVAYNYILFLITNLAPITNRHVEIYFCRNNLAAVTVLSVY